MQFPRWAGRAELERKRHRIYFRYALPFLLCFLGVASYTGAQKSSLEQGAFRIEIILEQFFEGKWTAVDPGLVLPGNAFVRFRLHTNFNGFLYAVNLGTNGNYTLLFPREETGTQNRIEADREYILPATEGGFRITGPPGYEIVYWLISPVALQSGSEAIQFPLQAPPLPSARKPAGKLIPRCNDKMFRARGECIDSSAGPQEVANAEDLPENLAGMKGAVGRGLEFSRREETAVVSSQRSSTAPVLFEFHLAHR